MNQETIDTMYIELSARYNRWLSSNGFPVQQKNIAELASKLADRGHELAPNGMTKEQIDFFLTVTDVWSQLASLEKEFNNLSGEFYRFRLGAGLLDTGEQA